jgi:hypothetical protein
MKKLLILAACLLIGCGESNQQYVIQLQREAELVHPDTDFGTIPGNPEHAEFNTMITKGWSAYMSVPGRKDGGWGWVIMQRKKQM